MKEPLTKIEPVYLKDDKFPKTIDMEYGKIYISKHKWALFECPCGCGNDILVSLLLDKFVEKDGKISFYKTLHGTLCNNCFVICENEVHWDW